MSVIGGRDIAEDRRRLGHARTIIGTLGRLLHLIKNNVISMKCINLIVLDEADKLLSSNFRLEIDALIQLKVEDCQIVASSATFDNNVDKLVLQYMQNPIAISSIGSLPMLIGIEQFLYEVDSSLVKIQSTAAPAIQMMHRKVQAVENIFKNLSFKQCILFSNSQMRAESYTNYFTNAGWLVDLIIGSQKQEIRSETIKKFRNSQSRILIASDLIARGVDIENVNLVINLDIPLDPATYIHRIGRCGRFGTHGIAITLVCDANDKKMFQEMQNKIKGNDQDVQYFPKGSNNIDSILWKTSSDKKYENNKVDLSVIEEKGEMNEDTSQTRDTEKIINENLKFLEIAALVSKKSSVADKLDLDANLFDDYSEDDILEEDLPPKEQNTNEQEDTDHATIHTHIESNENQPFINAMKTLQLEETDINESNSTENSIEQECNNENDSNVLNDNFIESFKTSNTCLHRKIKKSSFYQRVTPSSQKWLELYRRQYNQINRYAVMANHKFL